MLCVKKNILNVQEKLQDNNVLETIEKLSEMTVNVKMGSMKILPLKIVLH